MRWLLLLSPFSNGEAGTSRIYAIYPRSHSSLIVMPEFKHRSSDCGVWAPNHHTIIPETQLKSTFLSLLTISPIFPTFRISTLLSTPPFFKNTATGAHQSLLSLHTPGVVFTWAWKLYPERCVVPHRLLLYILGLLHKRVPFTCHGRKGRALYFRSGPVTSSPQSLFSLPETCPFILSPVTIRTQNSESLSVSPK